MSFFGLLLTISLLTQKPATNQANISVQIKNLTTGQIIEEYRPTNVVPPASVMKLLTTGAALETLGSDFRFVTAIEYSGTIKDGVLDGNLYIRGNADPSLGNRKKGQQTLINTWVKKIQAAGIQKINGSVIANMTLLDAEAQNPSWLMEDAGNYYAPGIFAINYMDNSLNVILRSGTIGTTADVLRTEPEIPYIRFINHVRCTETTYDGAYVYGLPYSNERYLTGSVPSNLGQFGVKSDIPNPGLLLAQHLTNGLKTAGVAVSRDPSYVSEGKVPPCTIIYEHLSDSLGALIAETNIHSNNLYAESIFRYLGLQYSKPGTVHASCDFLRDFWKRRGVDITGAIIKDGCGLAPQDAVSATTFIQLLSYMNLSKNRQVWYQSLPISGVSGTLRSLCAGTCLEGRIHAKSGTIAGTKNFAGYIDMPNGDRWAFAILISSAQGKTKYVQKYIEQYLVDVYTQNK